MPRRRAVTEMMGAWDYMNPGVLELGYEDIPADEAYWFRRLFAWYGFDQNEVEQGVEVALRFTPENVEPGDPGFGHRGRGSGVGYWRDHFTEPLVREFKQRYGGVLIRLGYEEQLDW